MQRHVSCILVDLGGKLNAVDPRAWLADTLARIPDYKITKVDDLLPWRWRGSRSARTLTALLGAEATNLSPGVIARLTAGWQKDYDRWQQRDLSARRYVYVWADGVYLQARMEPQAECMLVIIGATPEGRKELLGFQVGVRESAQSWRELLVDLKSRGLAVPPRLVVGDGALGFWKAMDEVGVSGTLCI